VVDFPGLPPIEGSAMIWLQWLGVVVGALVIIAVGLRVVGAARWAELARSHHRDGRNL
jgi:hypothetical protein